MLAFGTFGAVAPSLAAEPVVARPAAVAAVSFSDAFRSAREGTEPLKIQAELTTQAEARKAQAVGGIFPSVDLNGSYNLYDVAPGSGAAKNGSIVRLTANQPIFRGLREFSGVRQLSRVADAQRLAEQNAALELYQTVGEAFFGLYAAELDRRNLERLLELSIKRVDEIRSRVKIGRSRQSDGYSAEAQVAQVQAQVQAAEVTLDQARDFFAQATGLNRMSSLNAELKLPVRLEPLAETLKLIDRRPDVLAQKELLAAAEAGTSLAWGGHLPSVDLTGNYYLHRTGASASSSNSKWDLSLGLTFPLFQGGAVQAQVRESSSAERQAVLALDAARRRAEREIRSQYQATEGGLLQVEFLRKAADAAEKNYEAQVRDYRLGLVSNLDVLTSLNTYVDLKRQYDRAQSQVKIAWIGLQVATGKN